MPNPYFGLPQPSYVGTFGEDQVPPHHLLHTGYGQTKWVAEQLVSEARLMGLPCVVHLPQRQASTPLTVLRNSKISLRLSQSSSFWAQLRLQ